MADKVARPRRQGGRVTGSNSGIGYAIAQELSSRGANVVINYPSPSLEEQADDAAGGPGNPGHGRLRRHFHGARAGVADGCRRRPLRPGRHCRQQRRP